PDRRGRLLDRVGADRRGVSVGADGLALPVVRRGGAPEANRSLVGLVELREEGLEARGAARAEEEKPRRHRIEGPAVADALLAGRLAHALDDVVGGEPARLVDQEEDPALDARRRAHSPSFFGGRT